MAYSAKKLRTMTGGAIALGVAGMALVFWLASNHADPVFVAPLRVALGLTVVGLGLRAVSYADEVQRQRGQKLWFWGSLIGIAAIMPAVVFLQTHKPWLDTAVQFIFHHPAMPRDYFSFGVMLPVMSQCAVVLVARLMDKLSPGSRS
ncbi:MAG TPA: hypothetical protein VK515_11185 [Rhizomicrobium sp.]|nr:hypothetical protein [Rhizomicrobium sp.]